MGLSELTTQYSVLTAPSTAVKSNTTTVTQIITNTQTAAITTTKTIKEVSYIPTVTVVIMEKPLFGEESAALGVSIAMIVTSIIIGLRLKRKRVSYNRLG
jgi:carbohydrate-binding DOMON domain-containing protein